MDVLEIAMELVILSTVAAVAILIAELRDLAGSARFTRHLAATATSPNTVVNLAVGSHAANEESAAPRPELDRAA
jgi:hypothetical protein